jgi:hypothetical protein
MSKQVEKIKEYESILKSIIDDLKKMGKENPVLEEQLIKIIENRKNMEKIENE